MAGWCRSCFGMLQSDEAYRKRVNERTAATAKQKRMKMMTVTEANQARSLSTTAVGSTSRREVRSKSLCCTDNLSTWSHL